MVMRSAYLPSLIPFVAAAFAGFLIRLVGAVEGRLPTGGAVPVFLSSVLTLLLWVAVWKASRSVYPPLRLALVALIPFLIGATAGVIWATYAVVPGAALALVAVLLAGLMRMRR